MVGDAVVVVALVVVFALVVDAVVLDVVFKLMLVFFLPCCLCCYCRYFVLLCC